MTSMFEALPHSLAACQSGLLAQVGEGMRDGGSAGESWQALRGRGARRGCALDALSQEDGQALDRLFDGLGESGRDAQNLLLTETASVLEENLGAARRRAAEVDRLYVSLGVLLGLMLALIVM